VDIDPHAHNCTAEAMLAAITPATRLIIAVHTFGFPVDVKAILESLRLRGGEKISVIEDACEALGADVGGEKAGSLGDVGLFAFYPNKQITTGEGGMLITSNERIARQAARLRNQGRDPELGWNSHAEVGYSYRISDINCALGFSQLARIEAVIARRQELAQIYDRELAGVGEIVRPALASEIGRISWFVYPVQLAAEFSGADRDVICEAMLRKGIATGKYFAPLHRQPVMQKSRAFTTEDTGVHGGTHTEEGEGSVLPTTEFVSEEDSRETFLPNTEFVADRVIALPFFNELTEREIQEVCAALAESIHGLRRKT
jgi:perosamine synthetase